MFPYHRGSDTAHNDTAAQVDAYFTRFHFLMPIIDKPSFLARYNFIMDHTGDVTLARQETAFLALTNALFACAAKLVDDPRLSSNEGLDDAGMGMVYYERCLFLVSSRV